MALVLPSPKGYWDLQTLLAVEIVFIIKKMADDSF